MSTVQYFFYDGIFPDSPEALNSILTVAFEASLEVGINPKAILIRSRVHVRTFTAGKYIKDAEGWHFTLSVKDVRDLKRGQHVSCHAYVEARNDWTLRKATREKSKPDFILRHDERTQIWPEAWELIPVDNVSVEEAMARLEKSGKLPGLQKWRQEEGEEEDEDEEEEVKEEAQ